MFVTGLKSDSLGKYNMLGSLFRGTYEMVFI